MKRLFVILGVTLATAWSAVSMASNIGVVDMMKIVQNSPQVKQVRSQLQKQFAGQRDKLAQQEKSFQEKVQNFQKNRATMSKSQVDSTQKSLAEESNKIRTEQTKFQQAIFTAQNKAMNDFMKKVQAVTAKIAAKDNLDIVVAKNTVIYAKPSMDITSQVSSAQGLK